MFRCLRVLVVLGCLMLLTVGLAAQANAQESKEGGTAAAAAPENKSSQPSASSSEKADFPFDNFKEFSAITVGTRMDLGEGTGEAYIYRSGNQMRIEGPEGRGYFLTNLDTMETYGISASPCVYSKHAYFRTTPFPANKPGTKIERIPVGKETVDGHPSQVEDIAITPSQRGVTPMKLRVWLAEDLQGFPVQVKFLYPNGKYATVRYKNVVLGPQDPTLFVHPKSCEPLDEPRKKSKAPAKAAPAADDAKK